MTPEAISTFAYNVVGVAVGIGSGAAGVVGLVVKPYQKKLTHATSALEEAAKELQSLRTARVVEKIDEHGRAIEELKSQRLARVQERVQEHAKIEESVRRMIVKSDEEARTGRRQLHSDISSCEREIAKLGANFGSLEGWLKTVDERLDAKTSELIAAVANAAGRQGN